MNKKQLMTTGGLLIAVALFVAFNIFSNALFKSARLDLTDNNLYTLSQGTKNILQSLDEPVTLRFYLSQHLVASLPGINSYAVRVRELLEEYARAADGNLRLEIIDPEPFSEAEDRAVAFGLQGVPLEGGTDTFYFGLAGTNAIDGEEVIGFFQPNREEFLEYDVTKLVYQLAHPEQKVVGLMSSLPISGGPGANPFSRGEPAWMVVEQMKQIMDVRTIETDATEIPADIQTLMLVHPKNLSEQTLYALDQFVLRGGRLLAFVDPYSEADEPVTNPQNPLAGMNAPRNSNLKRLMDAWGVELVENKVVGDISQAQRVQTRKGSRTIVVSYPVWTDLREQNFNPDDIITGKLDSIVMATAGSLKHKEGAATGFIPLIQSSENAMLIETGKLGMFSDAEELARDYQPAGEKFVMAARVTGKVKTAFPDGKPKVEESAEDSEDKPEQAEAEQAQAEQLMESREDVNLVIIADTDLLEDKFWVQVQNFLGNRLAIPHAANATLVTNALDNLGGSNDLISVRNRGSFSRPFTKVEEIKLAAERKFREQEKALQDRLSNTEQKLRELQNQKQGGGVLILSDEQQAEIERFRNEQLKIRKELRNVQHELQKDIAGLENWMKFFNIWFMPLLVGIGGTALSLYRRRKRRELQAAGI